MTINEAIREAERILPGVPAPEGEQDARWQAIIKVGEFIETHPDHVWEFSLRWGSSECSDVRMAVATCLLEHLLEYHFDSIFPRVAKAVKRNRYFADTFLFCGKFGQSELPGNSRRIEGLKAKLKSIT
jgi:hypothetical protein